MNLPLNPGASAASSADVHVAAAMFRAARALDCPVCPSLRFDECVYTTAPVSVPVVPGTDVQPVRGYHAARLDAAGADLAATLGASAVVWDNGDAPRLPAPAEHDAGHEAAREVLYRAKEKLDNVGYLLASLAGGLESPDRVADLAAGLCDEDDDGTEPYCTTCGGWASIFIGHGDGWHHFRGEGTPASPVELYDAGHEVAPGWVMSAGRAVSPANMGLICQALADAAAWRSRPDGHADDTERAAAYEALGRRLAVCGLAGAATAGW